MDMDTGRDRDTEMKIYMGMDIDTNVDVDLDIGIEVDMVMDMDMDMDMDTDIEIRLVNTYKPNTFQRFGCWLWDIGKILNPITDIIPPFSFQYHMFPILGSVRYSPSRILGGVPTCVDVREKVSTVRTLCRCHHFYSDQKCVVLYVLYMIC